MPELTPELGKVLVVVGLVIAVVGGLAALGVRVPFGHQPGDIAIGGRRGGLYLPLGSMVVLSVLLTVVLNWLARR